VSEELRSLHRLLIDYEPGQIEINNGNRNVNLNREFYSTSIVVLGQSVDIIIEQCFDTLVTHIGINLFSEYPDTYSKYVYQFTERYLLNIILLKENHTPEETEEVLLILNDRNFNYSDLDKSKLVSLVNNFSSLTLTKHNDSFLLLAADNENNEMELQFGINYELITGMDKKELDEFIYKGLSGGSGNAADFTAVFIPPPKELAAAGENIYVYKNDQLIEGISNSRYYIIKDSQTEMLFDEQFPERSITNMFYEPVLAEKTPQLNVTQKLYGGRTENYKTSLQSFTNYFDKICELFTGVESVDTDSIKVILIYYAADLKLLHLAVARLNHREILNGTSGLIDCQLYANIRTDNIGDIFREYSNKKGKININID
jgi:hypothetical protein